MESHAPVESDVAVGDFDSVTAAGLAAAERSGALVDADTVYFTAGMWGTDGVHIYGLKAEDGSVIWDNDTSGSQYMLLPHNNYEGITGVSPQGYLALADGVLLVLVFIFPPRFGVWYLPRRLPQPTITQLPRRVEDAKQHSHRSAANVGSVRRA